MAVGQPFFAKLTSTVSWRLLGLVLPLLPADVQQNPTYATLTVAVVLAASGRDVLTLWHVRFNGYAIVFGLLAEASALAITVDLLRRRLPRRLAIPATSASLIGVFLVSSYVAVANARTVAAHNLFVNRGTMWRDPRNATDPTLIRDCPCQLTSRFREIQEEMHCLAHAN
jgi:hypothetical protein